MPVIQLKTSIPGPISKALSQRRDQAVPRGVKQLTSIFVARSEGAVLEDVDGNRFIDLAGGIGCLNAGHRAPAVTQAIHAQTNRFLHTCFMVTPYDGYVRLAERLNSLAPGTTPKKTLLLNSGAEAVENGIKIARAYTRRPAVICFEDAFHGRTMMAMSLTSKTHPYKAGFEPFASDVYRVPFAYCYRCAYSRKFPECEMHCTTVLEDTFRRVVAAESVAAIIAEPVLGEGGFIVPPSEYFKILRGICDKYGILLIADEVQTGLARTGKMFACEHYGIEPDLLLTAKTLGGGLPLAAVTGKDYIMDHTGPGALGGTFGGNPLACEAALATLDTIEQESLCERAMLLGDRFRRRAEDWQQRFSLIGEIRGLGAMQAVELVRDRESRAPASEEADRLTQYCAEHGVILLTTGSYGNIIRLLMPLVISNDEFDEALSVVESGFQAVLEPQAAHSDPVHA
ncbi:MAG: 4-aminobutyrate--2-oxoglutarate transaminase [Bryobacteraceae bacterium]|jgi:4-aminobutyrate aminotransferase/(S)-3-amino-2-methylpropionate transaminase